MASLRSRMVMWLMKNRHLLKFKLKKETIDWNQREEIISFREQCEKGAVKFGKLPKDIKVIPASIDDLNAEWIMPDWSTTDKVIFFIHGGGYVSGSCTDHRIHVSKFVKGTEICSLLFDYRLAPEDPFPAALDDTVKAYKWLLDNGTLPQHIVFAGDSAGGGLCLATLLALKEKNISLPAAAVVLSPWTDLTCSGRSYTTNAEKCLSPEGTWTAFSKHYAGNHNAKFPLISPLYGDLHGLCPLLIYVGEDEILYDDALSFSQKAQESGVEVTLRVGKGLFHCYPVCAPIFPEATEAMQEIQSFIKKHLT